MRIKVGVVGSGFASEFIPLFQHHPLVEEVVVADLIKERRENMVAQFGIKRSVDSLEALCQMNVDAIALFTNRHLHGGHTLSALQAGKHVYCAVPMASSVEEIEAILGFLKTSDLVYMTGETSYYYPTPIYCRTQFVEGNFGEFVYGEAAYYHDMAHGFYEAYQHSDRDQWTQAAGLPPMYYPTHSVSMILSVTGARATSVSCLGWQDHHSDGIFQQGSNYWDNIFSNETALMRTSDGGMMRINEFRRIGWLGIGERSVHMSLYGTGACFEEQANARVWTAHEGLQAMRDLEELLSCTQYSGPTDERERDGQTQAQQILSANMGHRPPSYFSGVSKVHPVHRLPDQFAGLPNGHAGSHQFLVDDFVKAVVAHQLPPNHAWNAARYCLPGLVAHESAKQQGTMLPIPDPGSPPPGWSLLDSNLKWDML